jgi:serine/threonine-protein kinase
MTTKCPKCGTNNPSDSKYCKECATSLIAPKDLPASYTKTLETPKEQFPKGTTFAKKYEIIEMLGKGGMGKVYKALDQEINEEVAIKFLKSDIAEDESTIERFRNELKIARRIAYKNVCTMYHLAKEEKTPYITMEYVDGESLKDFIQKSGKLSEEEAIDITLQIGSGFVGGA